MLSWLNHKFIFFLFFWADSANLRKMEIHDQLIEKQSNQFLIPTPFHHPSCPWRHHHHPPIGILCPGRCVSAITLRVTLLSFAKWFTVAPRNKRKAPKAQFPENKGIYQLGGLLTRALMIFFYPLLSSLCRNISAGQQARKKIEQVNFHRLDEKYRHLLCGHSTHSGFPEKNSQNWNGTRVENWFLFQADPAVWTPPVLLLQRAGCHFLKR